EDMMHVRHAVLYLIVSILGLACMDQGEDITPTLQARAPREVPPSPPTQVTPLQDKSDPVVGIVAVDVRSGRVVPVVTELSEFVDVRFTASSDAVWAPSSDG